MYLHAELFLLTLQCYFRIYFLFLLCNSGNKHQNNPFGGAETVRPSSTYIILHEMRGRSIHDLIAH